MRKITGLVSLLLLLLGCTSPDFYVSPSGDDLNPGTRAEPFRTISRAQEAVREMLPDVTKKDVTVWLADGTYPVSSAILFGPSDSGAGTFTIAYRAVEGAKPVISGGMDITGWEKQENGLWSARLPDSVRGKGFRELFIDGERSARARHPNAGYLRVAEVGADRRTHFRYHEGDFPEPANPQQVELVLLHDWSITRITLADIHSGNRVITAVDSIGDKSLNFFNLDNWEKDPRYFLENDLSFLDAPGEWYCDLAEGVVYLWLPGEKDPGEMVVTVPVTGPNLLVLEGTEARKVRNISFEGITFRYCGWQIPGMGYAGVQACHFDPRPERKGWSVVPPAVSVTRGDNIRFTGCTFSQLGGSGLWIGAGCTGCTLSGSRFEDISGNAVMIGEGRDRTVNGDVWWKTAPEQAARNNSILNNTVPRCGQQFYGAVGIWCGFVANTVIAGNHLYELPYTGISIGWEWSPAPSPCRDNHLTNNHIHHVMQILSDGGGIYMLGLQPGSILSGNLIHDVTLNAGRAESNGMFLDEGTTDVVVSGNIIYNIAKSPLRFHRATVNLVKDNVLSCAEGVPPVRYNATREEDIKLENNLVLQDGNADDRKKLEENILLWQNKAQTK